MMTLKCLTTKMIYKVSLKFKNTPRMMKMDVKVKYETFGKAVALSCNNWVRLLVSWLQLMLLLSCTFLWLRIGIVLSFHRFISGLFLRLMSIWVAPPSETLPSIPAFSLFELE
jgi:hypothetical protein